MPSHPSVEPHIRELLDSQLLDTHGMISIANRAYHPSTLLQNAAPHDYLAAAQQIINKFPWILTEHYDNLRHELGISLQPFHSAVEDWIDEQEADLRDYFTDGQLSPEACREELTRFITKRFAKPHKP